MTQYDLIPTPSPAPELPSDREVSDLQQDREPTCYSVTDRVHTLPAGLWDSDVVSTYEFLNTVSGVFVRIRSPLNVVMETEWIVRRKSSGEEDGEESQEWELVEDVMIKCSRFLVGVVKSTCESGWEGIHAKMMDRLKEESDTA